MSSSETDDLKGRAKEAAGALTGDDDLKEDGKSDQRAASAKKKVEDAADKVKKGIDDVKDRLTKN